MDPNPGEPSLSGNDFLDRYLFQTVILGFLAIPFFIYSLKEFRPIKDIWQFGYAKTLAGLQVRYNKVMDERKKKLFKNLGESGAPDQNIRLVEIGAGNGANFKYFPKGAKVICVDPNMYSEPYLMEEVKNLRNGVVFEEFKVGFAEDMSFLETSSVDVVVCSLVLCSVTNVEKSLAEILRILKPGGRFYFLEHVASKDDYSIIALCQKLLAPIIWFTFHCRFHSKVQDHIKKAGFSQVHAEYFSAEELNDFKAHVFMPLVYLIKPHYSGYAVK